jgi:hypothetical protein
MFAPLLLFLLFLLHPTNGEPLKMRVVVKGPPPPDALIAVGSISVVERGPPYIRNAELEELDRALTLASTEAEWSVVASPSPTYPQKLNRSIAPLEMRVPSELSSVWDGRGASVYVLDTGCEPLALPRSAVRQGPSFLLSPWEGDAHGHGTFVASIVLSAAPAANVTCVRVTDENGHGSLASLALGLAWVLMECAHSKACVVNLSLGVGGAAPSNVLNTLIDDLVISGNVAMSAADGLTWGPPAIVSGLSSRKGVIRAPGTRVVGANSKLFPPLTTMSGSSVSAAWTTAVLAQVRGARPQWSAADAHAFVAQHKDLRAPLDLPMEPPIPLFEPLQPHPPKEVGWAPPRMVVEALSCSDVSHPTACARLKCECAGSHTKRRALLAEASVSARTTPKQSKRHPHPRVHHALEFIKSKKEAATHP